MQRDENGKVVIVDGDCVYVEKEVTLEEAAKDVIDEINREIQKNSADDSITAKRHVVLSTNRGNLREYSQTGLGTTYLGVMTDEKEKKIWLRRIVNALVAKRHLYKLETTNGHGYFIQA